MPTNTLEPQVSRRTIAKGAAWSVPAVVVGAPAAAMAASQPCGALTTANWTGQTSPSAATGSNGMSATSAAGSGTYLKSDNMTLFTVNNGSPQAGKSWLMLDQTGANASGQTVTITLPKAYCVTFYVNDIDSGSAGVSSRYRDDVIVSGFTATAVGGAAAYVTTSGSEAYATNTATGTSTAYDWDNSTGVNGLVKFTNSATTGITSIVLQYKNINQGTGTTVSSNPMQMYISPITFSTTPCACP